MEARKMSGEKKRAKSERLIKEAIKARGYIFPEWEFVCRLDPDLFESYNNLYASSLGKSGALSIKVKEFIALALLAFRGSPTDVLVSHMKRAMDDGATKEELLEALAAAFPAGGAPTFFNGLKALMSLDKKSSD
jgi:alkylhydroperoxidase/carboxymuconolactone decarboxylase family protein YurZ